MADQMLHQAKSYLVTACSQEGSELQKEAQSKFDKHLVLINQCMKSFQLIVGSGEWVLGAASGLVPSKWVIHPLSHIGNSLKRVGDFLTIAVLWDYRDYGKVQCYVRL